MSEAKYKDSVTGFIGVVLDRRLNEDGIEEKLLNVHKDESMWLEASRLKEVTDQPKTGSETPETDVMQRIVFEGCECIVIAPEDMEEIERSRNAIRAENERQEARIKELEAELHYVKGLAKELMQACSPALKKSLTTPTEQKE